MKETLDIACSPRQPDPFMVCISTEVLMSYEDYTRMDDSELRDFVAARVDILDWEMQSL
jgi:hypothetical protein